ncbi:xanthine dehydrogenase family protein molybdopterin-binding subunit [Oceanispirochaeta sp.]|jgi:CO/xanthine dehydrogenase Mo-binding subunit|uniref:xanthine dehydrogenase family protein molybdopterin-binding subunit n=1 Tax=Oceanispirochaeta sp. TaxID=2035350 RepID=UPI002628A003|nr:xanthine dehydrogenase family protein molybdopterin-binding subunit [Oceanispirochaeta sp.]MDA3956079.1 xanthine dehydrogenase family protein molybdopterin-binding subunit [Oceanispirochaeta sp.]
MPHSISTSVRRKDAVAKAAGTMEYLADQFPVSPLHGKCYYSSISRGTIESVSLPELPEGYYIVGADDIQGVNRLHMIIEDWPVFADKEVRYLGQIIFLVVGPEKDVILDLHKQIQITYRELTPCITLEESTALLEGVQHGEDNVFTRYDIHHGQVEYPFEKAHRILEKEYYTGHQEHVYMEPQSLFAHWEEDTFILHASAQCPFYIRKSLVNALGMDKEKIRIIQTPTGGAFGGKEHFPDVLAGPLAVAVCKIKKPIKLVLDRKEDMAYSIKRHPSAIHIRTALDKDGRILAHDIDLRLDGGAFASCSAVVLARAVFTVGNVYNINNIRICGRVFCTNKPPSDAFRGFGAPQAIFAMESHMNFLAYALGIDPLAFRQPYLMKQGDPTSTDGKIHEEVMLPEMTRRILEMSGYEKKYQDYKTRPNWGIGLSYFFHGSGFTGNGERDLIKARIYLKKNRKDQVFIYGSNVEMGQGISTTFCKVASKALDIPIDQVHFVEPDTEIVPDSGPTVASRSISVVGFLVQKAAKRLKAEWKSGEDQSIIQDYEAPTHMVPWDQETLTGDAYPAYSWGVNVIEVEVDPLSYEVNTKGIWGVYEMGVPIDRQIVEGQIIGGMIQALGYSYLEKLEFSQGRFRQATMSDYMIPTSMDFPTTQCDIVDNPFEYGAFGAKGAGEMVFDGAAPAFGAAVSQAVDTIIDEVPVLPETLMELTDEGR